MGDTMGQKARALMREAGFSRCLNIQKRQRTCYTICVLLLPPINLKPSGERHRCAPRPRYFDAAPHGAYLSNADAYRLLECFGISYAKNALIRSDEELAALEISYPVVAKIEHPEIVHKSDVGGVRLNIENKAALADVYKAFMATFKGATGVLVQEQLPQGIELIVGSACDPVLGNALMVGMGGTFG